MIVAYRYRLLPTKAQHRALEAILEAQRQLYNAALEERIGAFRKANVCRTYFDQTRALTEWRQSDADARTLPVSLQRATLKRLDNAYGSFFRRIKRGEKPGFPRFRGIRRFNCFGFAEMIGIHWQANRISFQGMPRALRVHLHRPLPADGSIKTCTFHRTLKGWDVCAAIQIPDSERRPVVRMVGVDLGISTFATLSDGGTIPSLHAARRSERRLRVAQRALARKGRQTGGRRKARDVLARCYGRITRARSDHAHRASARLVREYDAIAIEKLKIHAMAKGLFAKPVRDAGWSLFISMLRYKAERAGVHVVDVDARGTSRDCSRCGAAVPKALSDRRHECPECHLSLDRDLNAALNILNRAGMGPGLHNVAG